MRILKRERFKMIFCPHGPQGPADGASKSKIQLLETTCCLLLTWWLLRGGCTRSLSEHGRETPLRQWYFVSRRGRVGRCQVYKMQLVLLLIHIPLRNDGETSRRFRGVCLLRPQDLKTPNSSGSIIRNQGITRAGAAPATHRA